MKRNILRTALIMMTMIFVISSSACTDRRSVNDADTGEVQPGELKYSYTDGSYKAYTPYYNDEGYAAAMKLTVENGIISEIRFELYDRDMEPYSQRYGEEYEAENEEFRSTVKNLNTRFMQAQSSDDLRSSSRYAEYYLPLARECEAMALEGAEEEREVILTEEYNASIVPEEESEDALSYALTVRYQGEKVIYISFRELSSDGKRLTGFPEGFVPPEEVSVTYQEMSNYLNLVTEDMTELKKDNPWDCPLNEIDMYNVLSDMIERKHVWFEWYYSPALSSR